MFLAFESFEKLTLKSLVSKDGSDLAFDRPKLIWFLYVNNLFKMFESFAPLYSKK